ncbi:MAG: alpha/beta fold hydrolase [Nocardioides sp.]
MHRIIGAAAVALVVAVGLSAPASAGSPQLPTSPAGEPTGANDWSCVPSAERPTPVVLVHGTFGDRRSLLDHLSSAIAEAGSCVYSLDYGNRGTGDIRASAKQLKRFVHRVRSATGADRVSMVGHSQGGMMPRYYIKRLRGARHVDDLIGLAPSNHGTVIVGEPGGGIGRLCVACDQQAAGSPFLSRLNRGDETPGRVSYTQVITRYDEVVVPATSGFLAEGPRTTNVTVQDLCPGDIAEHVLIPMSRTAIAVTLDALAHRGPADPGLRPACGPF